MRCVKCHNEMQRVNAGNNVFYYECKHCGYAIGKPTENMIVTDLAEEPDAVKTITVKEKQ